MEGKIIHTNCQNCNESITFDFNEDDFSTEITILNKEKEEIRTFIKKCSHCNELNVIRSSNSEEWGTRRANTLKKIMIASTFSCFVMLIIFALIAYFAGKGIITVWNWLF